MNNISLILLNLTFLLPMTMPKNYIITPSNKLIEYLESKSKDPMDCDYQLSTNYAYVYHLKNDEVVFIPNTFQGDGILFKNTKSFDDMVKNEVFPIENPDKTFFETEMNSIISINKNIGNAQKLFNEQLQQNFATVDSSTLKIYYEHTLSENGAGNKYLIALITLVGDHLKKINNGRWALIKKYGQYNPYYEPVIITKDNKIIFLVNRLFGMWESNIKDFDVFFKYQSIKEPKIELLNYISDGNKILEID